MSEKIKVLFFHFDLGNGGAERVLVNLANALPRERYDVEVRTLFNYGPNRERLSPHVRYTRVLDCKPFRGVSVLLKLLPPRLLHRLMIRRRYDVEIAYREGVPSRIVSGGRNSGTRRYSWIHTAFPSRRAATKGYRSFDELISCCRHLEGIAAVSDNVREAFELHIGIRATTVHNVIDRDSILAQAAGGGDDIRLDTQTINLVTVGRLTPVKGYDRLIDVLGRLAAEGCTGWHMYIIGVGEQESALKQRCRERGVEQKVTFLGFRSNPYRYVSRMQLFVCSSLREGYSTAVTEAVIVGTPVLTTACSGMEEILGGSEAGEIVENSAEGLYRGLRGVLADPERLAEMRQAAEERSSAFAKEVGVREFEAFIANG